ncbi:MAG: hypothetical protein JW736_05515 [Deltaproteobacteria bacterium]|nr:hypothetical protein [Deltaproteobacteria bacterium]
MKATTYQTFTKVGIIIHESFHRSSNFSPGLIKTSLFRDLPEYMCSAIFLNETNFLDRLKDYD